VLGVPTRTTLPAPRLAVERFTLPNGLRTVLNPDRSAPTVGIAVFYDVGFRSEPEGRSGFAHLFEHLMFQGSATLEKGEADRLIEGNGGVGNGSTHSDYTNYIAQLPSNALELGIFLEADRMRAARLTAETMRNQIDVVKEEIRVNVLNRPYGGFPWIDLPPVMFDSFNNAHDGYGSFVDLESATIEDAADFFGRFYCPSNAVLSVAGDLDPDATRVMIERHFAGIRRRRAPGVPDCSEPLPTEERRASMVDPLAPLPAVAVGYRVPDPISALDEYLAVVVAGDVLAGGEASRLYQRLVKRDRTATHAYSMLGTFGDPFDVRDPTMLQLLAYLPPGTSVDRVLAAMDEEVARVAEAVPADEIDRVVTALVSDYFRQLDSVLERAMVIGVLEQQRSRGEWVNELPAALARVTPEGVAAAAGAWLCRPGRAVLEVVPGAGARQ
jgi:predicted Zn-dependent peptidase